MRKLNLDSVEIILSTQQLTFKNTRSKLKTLVLLLFINSSFCIAQNASVSGKLVDEKGLPVSFGNVTLLKTSGNTLSGATLTDSTGIFNLNVADTGEFYLLFTAIGFGEKKTEPFEITGNNFSKNFSSITLVQETKNLSNVTITALRPTITQLPDKMVVSIEGTAMAAGNTAFAVLARAPGVFIDPEGNIQLNGRSGVTVMLDGRLTYLSARDLRNLLEGMSAENIKNIEIITNPSAKYDAEGTSGILNINLKKNTQQGINGSVHGGYNYNFQQHGFTVGGNINHKIGKWNSFLTLDAARRVGGREATFTRIFYGTKTTYFNQVATGNFVSVGPPTVRLGTDYTINPNHSVGFMFNFTRNTADQEFLTETFIGNQLNNPKLFIDADNFSSNTYTNYTSNFHYTAKLDTTGSTFTTDLDYVQIKNRGESYFYNTFKDFGRGETITDNLYNHTPNGYNIYSAKADVVLPQKNGQKWEFGAKASEVNSNNDFRFYFMKNDLIPDITRTNHFKYSESILAGYINWSGNLTKKISVQTGLRAEHTNSFGNSITLNKQTPRKYINFFPTVFIQQNVSDNYNINYNYGRRISRPNYGNLNPFRAYRDPYTWYEGNTELRPQYTHAFTITQTFHRRYNLTASYQLLKDVMSEIPILLVEDTVTIYTTGNLDQAHSVSLTGVAPLKITKWWDTQNVLVFFYNKFATNSDLGNLENDQMSYSIQSNHTILLPKEVRMELNMSYRSPRASGLYHMAAMHRVDVAFKKSFFQKKFDLTLNANDIFKGFRYLWTTDINGNVNDFDQYFRWRSIGINLRYNFSKGQKVENKRRNNSLEEVNRT